MIERTDSNGRWESNDDGRSWALVEPSQAWLDERAAAVDPEPIPTAEERIAELEAVIAALLETP